MADADPRVTIDDVYSVMQPAIAAAFPAFKLVEFDRDDEDENIALPALLLHLADTDPAPEASAGTGQWPTRLRFEARVIVSARSPVARREAIKAATALATWLHKRRFPGLVMDPAVVTACEPDEFAPHLNRFHVWRVEWLHLAYMGESAWADPGELIGEAWYSWAPEIGPPNVDDYQPLDAGDA